MVVRIGAGGRPALEQVRQIGDAQFVAAEGCEDGVLVERRGFHGGGLDGFVDDRHSVSCRTVRLQYGD